MCWDNAAAESFFAALKNEMYYRQAFPTRARARFAVAGYIEVFCACPMFSIQSRRIRNSHHNKIRTIT